MSTCHEYDRLSAYADRIMGDLAQTTVLLREVFRARKQQQFTQIDQELEHLVWEKERALGALREHAKEHKCQPAP